MTSLGLSLKPTSDDNHGYKSSNNKTKSNDNILNSNKFRNNGNINIKGELYREIVSEIIEKNVEQNEQKKVLGFTNNIVNEITKANTKKVSIVQLLCCLYISLGKLKQSQRKMKGISLNGKAIKALKINLDPKNIIKKSRLISKKVGIKLSSNNIKLTFDELNNIDGLLDAKKGDTCTNNVDNDDGFDGFDDDDLNDMKSSIKNERNNDGFDTEFDDELNNIKKYFIMDKIGIKLPNINYDNIKSRFGELNNIKDCIVDNYDELYPTKKDDTNNVDNNDEFDDDDLNDMKSSIKNETNNDAFDTEFDDEINNYIIKNPNEIDQEQQKFDRLYPKWLLKTRNNDNIEPYHISKVTKDGEVIDYIGLRIRDSDDDRE